tara:strand:- start:284 stop:1213 length:930 start_codon:yes stop_codon:yes gene_type:complete
MAKNIGIGDAVFTTNFSFFATTEVISTVGATPVFVDIDKKTFNLDPAHLEFQINEVIKIGKLKPKAVIAVDLFGQLCNYTKIKEIVKKYNLLLIEDAAQSFGASFKNKKSCSFGDVAATSFFPAKPLGCYGDGGAIFTNNNQFADLCRSIRVHGMGKDKYDNVRIGMNSRLDTLQAAILLNKLNIFDNEINLRNKNAEFFSKGLEKNLIVPYVQKDNISSWAQYSLLASSEQERDSLIEFLNQQKIPTAIYYKKPFNSLDIYKHLNYHNNEYNISHKLSKRIFSIPMHPYLNETQLNTIISTINKFFKS